MLLSQNSMDINNRMHALRAFYCHEEERHVRMKGEMEQMTELEAECRHRYRVRSIREDDYGCEERPEGVWPTVLVELEDENGQLRLLRQKDHYLYEQQIEEGDQVILEQEILKRIE